ncbi:MAG: hypothetical protein IJY20_00920 [Clostridia bacterium]|nr:hypothetical protein [Clostridia bacterium]
MNVKKLLSLLLVLTMLFSFAACHLENPSDNTTGQTPNDNIGDGTGDQPSDKTEDTPPAPSAPTMTITPSSPYALVGSMMHFTVSGDGFDREALTYTVTEGMTNSPITTETGCKARIISEGELTVTAISGELSASCTVTAFPQESTITPDNEWIYYLGRTEMSGEKMLINNTAAGFEIKFYGQSVSAKLRNEGGDSVFAVFVDDETDPTAHNIRLSTDLVNGKAMLAQFEEPGFHTLRVQKITEEQISRASLVEITIEKGGLLPYEPAYDLKIEVYGDSITAAYGNLRAESEPDDQKKQNGLLSYAAIAATRLRAEYRTFCQSGIGLYTNPYNATRWMKDTYANVSPSSNTPWDMQSYTPDVVIINVGTNDIWAQNGSTGNQPFNANDYIEHYVTFVTNLYKEYGEGTTFILCSGMMETGLASSIDRVANRLYEQGITEVYSVVLPLRSGYGGHPCLAAHKAAAEVLLAAICEARGLEIPEE